MAKVETRNGVLKTGADGSRTFVGWTREASLEGLTISATPVLVLDDGTVWALSAPEALVEYEEVDLAELKEGELRRRALSKLDDAEIAALKLVRE